MPEHRFIRACRRLPVDKTPVWFMGQAGPYQPEYRALRKKYSLLDICRRPEVCAEVTLRPVQQLDVDAAILFSDVSVLFEPLGVPFELQDNVGPVISRPLTSGTDVDNLRSVRPEEDLPWVFDTIRLLVNELDVPLIGFACAPFTLAGYLLEGGPSRSFTTTRRMMYEDEGLWNALMEQLTAAVGEHLRAQAHAGASALQLFDNWVGILSSRAYHRFVAPHMARLFAALTDVGVPLIHFTPNAAHLMADVAKTGADVIGVDWRIPIDAAWKTIGFDRAIQGNLDPAVLLGPWEAVRDEATDILARVERVGGPGHIFSLGHDVLPTTTVDRLRRIVDLVRDNVPQSVTSLPTGLPPRFPAPLPRSTNTATDTAVLLMAYGSPASLSDIEPYYTHIRGGRRPLPEQVEDLTERYKMIGGVSPLTPITLSLAHKLEQHLGVPVYTGMRHAEPFIAHAVRRMAADGIKRAIGITLAPHYSKMSIGAYIAAAEQALAEVASDGKSVEITFIDEWGTHPLFVQAIARRLRRAAIRLFPNELSGDDDGILLLPDDAIIIFTAHSLPTSIRQWNDPYEERLRISCERVAEAVGSPRWTFAYQSAGSTGTPWLGPDITEVIPKLAAVGVRSAIICPIGFVADHLEIYYDIDIEAREAAEAVGVRLVRTASLNDDDDFVDVLAAIATDFVHGGAPHR